MAISSVSSGVNIATAVQPQILPSRVKDLENDKDKDDGASKAAAQNATAIAETRPTVNTTGRVVGSVTNTQA